jgi:hypothetical protein
MMEQEQKFFKSDEQSDEQSDELSDKQYAKIKKALKEAREQGIALGCVEGDLWGDLLELGRLLMQEHVDEQGDGDLGPTIEHEGKTLNRLETRYEKRYVSVFGELRIMRTVYGTRESQKHELVPLDARLNLPEGDFSFLLQDWSQAFCVQGSYKQSGKTIEKILGIGQSVRSLEHMNGAMARDVEEFHVSQPEPVAEEEGPILVLTADGKGIPMRRENPLEIPQGRRGKGDKANKKRMACVGAAYTIQPFVREAEDVVEEQHRQELEKERPQPLHKRMRAELTREIEGDEVNGKDRIFRWFTETAAARNPDGEKAVVCLMDGERALWKKAEDYGVDAVCILDIYHVLERLWSAAYCFLAEGSQEAEAFVTERLTRLLKGQVGRVIGGLKQMMNKQALRGTKKKQLQAVITYMENNRDSMQYDYYLEMGYPIGSGVVEGACRHLVKDRMEGTGMRWRTEGAQSMLDLRAVYLNGDWEKFQEYRVEQNVRKLYPYRERIQELWSIAA